MSKRIEEHLRRAARPTLDALHEMEDGRSRLLRSALAEIREHFWEPGYQVLDLKRSLGASNWLLSIFRIEIGLTPWRLIQECRMETAWRLLRDTSLPVEEIAFLVGYVAAPPFQRLCKRWCGLYPARLRSQARRVRVHFASLPEETVTWYFWERFRRSQLADDEVRRLLEYFETIYGRAP